MASDSSQTLRTFAVVEARGRSPLYERLAVAGANDPTVCAILDEAPPPQRRATLLFAAIHYLVLGAGLEFPEDAGSLRAFCVANHAELIDLMRSRRTQTNEVLRSAVLLPALSLAAGAHPIALLEVGASAGLNLCLERYRYRYGDIELGDPSSPILLEPTLSGSPMPRLPMPSIAERLGMDLAPVDLSDPDAVTWLRACVWRDQVERLARLDLALALVTRDPPTVIAGDATTELANAASRLAGADKIVVFHSNVATYLDRQGRQHFRAALDVLAAERDLAWVFAESPGVVADLLPEFTVPDPPADLLGIVSWPKGVAEVRILANIGPQASRLAWFGG